MQIFSKIWNGRVNRSDIIDPASRGLLPSGCWLKISHIQIHSRNIQIYSRIIRIHSGNIQIHSRNVQIHSWNIQMHSRNIQIYSGELSNWLLFSPSERVSVLQKVLWKSSDNFINLDDAANQTWEWKLSIIINFLTAQGTIMKSLFINIFFYNDQDVFQDYSLKTLWNYSQN